MVLGTLSGRNFMLIVALSLVVGAQGVWAQMVTVAGYTFELKEEGGKCIIFFSGEKHSGRLTFVSEPPCEFVRTESGDIRYFKYDDVGIDAVIIVIGSPLTDIEKAHWKVSADIFCGNVAQGLLVRREGVLVSKEVMSGGIVCATTGVDEKRFYQFAHPLSTQ